MDYQAFRKKLDSLNKLSLAALISGIGLKRQDAQILKWWYIDELNINEIAQANRSAGERLQSVISGTAQAVFNNRKPTAAFAGRNAAHNKVFSWLILPG